MPGTFILVDHSIFRTFNKGSLGMLKVEGPENKEIYSGKQSDSVYLSEGGAIQSIEGEAASQKPLSRARALPPARLFTIQTARHATRQTAKECQIRFHPLQNLTSS